MSVTRDVHGSRHAPALLDQIADTAVDEDYATAAQRRAMDPARDARRAPRRPGRRLLVLVTLGLLLATGVVQTARSEPAARQARADLRAQLDAGQDQLATQRTRLAALQRDLSRLEARAVGLGADSAAEQGAAVRTDRLAAADRLVGKGLLVTADDAIDAEEPQQRVLDKDLQRLVNALWAAGARGIAVDGVRLSALSSIRTAGQAITADYRSIRAPYRIEVVGDPNELQTGFVSSAHGRYWYELQQSVGVRLELTPRERLVLPPARRLSLRQAEPTPAGPSRAPDQEPQG